MLRPLVFVASFCQVKFKATAAFGGMSSADLFLCSVDLAHPQAAHG